MTNSIRVFAPAKINLFLHVGEKRGDGFHALESLAVFVDVGDELTIHRADELSLSIEGPFARNLSTDEDNLVLKAARALNATARIVLVKNLPVASGIGGGSADAAAALHGLNDLLQLGRTDLHEVAAKLGSDVPVCLSAKATWMEGRGEVLTLATVSRFSIALVNPRVGVSTADVFRTLAKRSGLGARKAGTNDLAWLLKQTTNDLEAPARALQPVIGDVLDSLRDVPDVLLARMSGSGATCFGLFENDASASQAARVLSASHPDWWVHATKIIQ